MVRPTEELRRHAPLPPSRQVRESLIVLGFTRLESWWLLSIIPLSKLPIAGFEDDNTPTRWNDLSIRPGARSSTNVAHILVVEIWTRRHVCPFLPHSAEH